MIWLRALALVTLGTALFAAAPFVLYPSQSAIGIDFTAEPPRRIVSGFYPGERTEQGLTFAWTRGTFGFVLPGLDRRVAWTATMRLAAARPDGSTVALQPSVDGAALPVVKLETAGFSEQAITLPARADGGRGASVAFQVSPTFVPGPADTRELGVQVDWIGIQPSGRPSPPPLGPWPAVLGGVAGLVLVALAIPFSAALGLLAVFSLAVAAIVTRGVGPFVPFAGMTVIVPAGVTTAAVIAALSRVTTGARVVAGLTFGAIMVKLLVLFHPDMPIGDALFHAHRFQDVLAGKLLFTSIAPGDYMFPYAIGLYVFAAIFEPLTTTAFDNVALLRIVVVAADAFAAALLYRLVVRWRQDQIAGVAAIVAYHLMPLSFLVVATGNLTNVFAQSLATVVLVAMTTTIRGPLAIAAVAALASAAMLSHTSTFAVLSVQLVAASAWLALTGDAERRRTGRALAVATAGAVVLAVALYYAHFLDTYREAWARITAETGRATEAAGGRTPSMRLADVPRLLGLYYGWPAVFVATLGFVRMIGHRADRSITRPTLAVWLVVCGSFLVIGIVTPVDMRHYLAALPLLAVFVGIGVGEAISRVKGSRAKGRGQRAKGT